MSFFLPYHVVMFRTAYAVYRWNSADRNSAHQVSIHTTYNEARNEAYRLNGEYFKQKKL